MAANGLVTASALLSSALISHFTPTPAVVYGGGFQPLVLLSFIGIASGIPVGWESSDALYFPLPSTPLLANLQPTSICPSIAPQPRSFLSLWRRADTTSSIPSSTTIMDEDPKPSMLPGTVTGLGVGVTFAVLTLLFSLLAYHRLRRRLWLEQMKTENMAVSVPELSGDGVKITRAELDPERNLTEVDGHAILLESDSQPQHELEGDLGGSELPALSETEKQQTA